MSFKKCNIVRFYTSFIGITMRKIWLLLFVSVYLVGCSSYKDAMNANSNIKKVELGMTKNDVIQKMGKYYHRMELNKASNGIDVEVLGYPTVDAIYMLRFENGELVEFHKDLVLPNDKLLRESSLE